MFFKRSKAKQLSDVKYELCLLREGLIVQRNQMKRLVEQQIYTPEEIAECVDRIYEYVIDRIKLVEEAAR